MNEYACLNRAPIQICNCGAKMKYYSTQGLYECPVCKSTEQDMFGFLKELLEENPRLTKKDLSQLLEMSISELDVYFKGNTLINPRSIIF